MKGGGAERRVKKGKKRDNSFPRKDRVRGKERGGRRRDKTGGLSKLLGKD